MRDYKKILVIKLGALGDFIQALGPMKAIRANHPKAHITLLTTKPYQSFAEQCGYFDTVWVDERPEWYNIPGWLSLKKRLKESGFERIYDLQNNDRTSFYFRFFDKEDIPEWVGTAKGASHCNDSPERSAGHAFDGHIQTLGMAGIDTIEIDTLDWMQTDISKLGLKKPYVLLVPGSSPKHPLKRWPAEKYGRTAKMLSLWGYQPVVIGGDAEKSAAKTITGECFDALNLVGKTDLISIAAIAREAAGAIGNDTGPIHLIAATGCPTLTLFSGKSNPIKHKPLGKNVAVIQEKNLANLRSENVLKMFQPREKPVHRKAGTLH